MANTKQDAAALPLGPQDLPAPAQHRVITDPAAIKALADPLRLGIMRVMQKGAHENPRSFTVKQIAAELGEPPTKLYRHIKLLLKTELIQVAEVRLVGGIVEQHYRVAQAGFVIKPEYGDGLDDEVIEVAGAAVDEFLTRYLAAIQSGRAFLHKEDSLSHAPFVPGVGMISSIRIPREKAAEFGERISALTDEFCAFTHDRDGVEANLLAVFYATE